MRLVVLVGRFLYRPFRVFSLFFQFVPTFFLGLFHLVSFLAAERTSCSRSRRSFLRCYWSLVDNDS